MSELHEPLLNWYRSHRRDLPWRRLSDPYATWVSEIMLQQTTVAAVVPYFERWMERFATVEVLAAAEEADVMPYWSGLGYYSRARQLLKGAKSVADRGMPNSVSGWLAVPGVGPYTAGAIASIGQGIPAALVDGNVERVFSRLTDYDKPKPKLTAAAWDWAARNVHQTAPSDWNQALMELGATVCTPRDPKCTVCPVSEFCVARQRGTERLRPAVVPKPEPIQVFHEIFVWVNDGKVALRVAGVGEWWNGLHVLPWKTVSEPINGLPHVKFTVTKHRITGYLNRQLPGELPDDLVWIGLDELEAIALPSPHRKAIKLAAS